MGDHGGYIAHTAETLKGLQFTQLQRGSGENQYSFDETFRHGTVIQLSAAEEERLLAVYGNTEEEPYEPVGLLAEYTFEDGTLADSAGDHDLVTHGSAAVQSDDERGHVLSLDGANGGFAEFPRGMFDRLDQLTISLDMKSDKDSGNFFSFAFGQDNQRYYFLRARGDEFRSAITNDSWGSEGAVTGEVVDGSWHHYDIVFDDNVMTVYVDGIKMGVNDELGTNVSGLGRGLIGYLGKSFYGEDGYFQGAYDNIHIYDEALDEDDLLGEDQLIDVSLADSDVLKIDPIVAATHRNVTFPVVPGTDLTALAPTFDTAKDVTVTPASGEEVDLTEPVTYTLTLSDGSSAEWTMKAIEMRSPCATGNVRRPEHRCFR